MPRPADPNAKIDLLRAAETVFVERGLDHAKVEDITERAGHSKGSFYLHFGIEGGRVPPDRRVDAGAPRRLPRRRPRSTSASRLPAAEHVARWRAQDLEMFEFIWANRRVMRLMLEGGGSAEFGYLIDQFADRTRKQAAEALRLGVADGLYRADLDVEVASMVLAGGYDRVARELVRGERKPDLAKLLATLQRVCLTGIASPRLAAVVDPPVKKSARDGTEAARASMLSVRANAGTEPVEPADERADGASSGTRHDDGGAARPARAALARDAHRAPRSCSPASARWFARAAADGAQDAEAARRRARHASPRKRRRRRRRRRSAARAAALVTPKAETLAARGAVRRHAAAGARGRPRLQGAGPPGARSACSSAIASRPGRRWRSLDATEAEAQVKAAEAQVRAAEAQLALADDSAKRTSTLVGSGAASPQARRADGPAALAGGGAARLGARAAGARRRRASRTRR